jgi:thiamine-phosphate pyrophosphorylase
MIRGFYFITDSGLTRKDIIKDSGDAIAGGTRIIQYREKSASTGLMYETAITLKELCRDVLLIINDRIDIARAVGADGVHLGQDDMPYGIARKLLGKEKIIGITVHDLNEAVEAERAGADYLGVSPVFPTATKEDAGSPCGISLVKEIKYSCNIPIAAIGGITLDNAKSVINAGADAICAISATVASENVKNAVENFQGLFKG